MKEIIFNRNDYKSYKDFYLDAYKKLEGERFDDFDFCKPDLGCNGDILWEFLEYCCDDGNQYIFVNFDKNKIKEQKNFDDYKYNIVIEVFEMFAEKFPNNSVEFKMDEK